MSCRKRCCGAGKGILCAAFILVLVGTTYLNTVVINYSVNVVAGHSGRGRITTPLVAGFVLVPIFPVTAGTAVVVWVLDWAGTFPGR